MRTTPIPGTGPYRIAYAIRKETRYVRNPFFHEWSHAAQPAGNPDVIVMRYGMDPTQELRAVERGEADWSADGVPAKLLSQLTTRYASRLHSYPGSDTEFLQINTTLPPFDDLRVRRALNYAIDRRVVTRLFGGPAAATPACQVLPPGLFGYSPYCPAPTRAAGKARVEGARSRTRPPPGRRFAHPRRGGHRLGHPKRSNRPAQGHPIHRHSPPPARLEGARAHIVPGTFFQNAPAGIFRTIQMTPRGWADTAPYNFFAPWFACDSPYNHHWFCGPALDRKIVETQALEATDPRAAAAEWAALDRLVTDRAAWGAARKPSRDRFPLGPRRQLPTPPGARADRRPAHRELIEDSGRVSAVRSA